MCRKIDILAVLARMPKGVVEVVNGVRMDRKDVDRDYEEDANLAVQRRLAVER